MTTHNPADWYVYPRSTTSGGTVYEPMHRDADPDDASTGPSFRTPEAAQAWIDGAPGAAMVTATYTDQATGWQQRVVVLSPAVADAPAPDQTLDWTWVRNTDGEHAKVPNAALSDHHTEPPFLPSEDDDDPVDPAGYVADCATTHIINTGEGNYSRAVRAVAPGAARHATSPRVRALAERLVANPNGAEVADIAAAVKRRFTPFIHPIT